VLLDDGGDDEDVVVVVVVKGGGGEGEGGDIRFVRSDLIRLISTTRKLYKSF